MPIRAKPRKAHATRLEQASMEGLLVQPSQKSESGSTGAATIAPYNLVSGIGGRLMGGFRIDCMRQTIETGVISAVASRTPTTTPAKAVPVEPSHRAYVFEKMKVKPCKNVNIKM
jgi:hypothetical protein